MCGLVGVYSSSESTVVKDSINILKRLEYRGYDSAGVLATKHVSGRGGEQFLKVEKVVGRVSDLEKKCEFLDEKCQMAIAHTRWATNGNVTVENCHPHTSMNKIVSLVHNGIIENYRELAVMLSSKGYKFNGQTDSEILANFIEYSIKDFVAPSTYHTREEIFKEISNALSKVTGAYALVVIVYDGINQTIPQMYGFHRGSPLVVGESSDGRIFLCSDLNSLKGFADRGVSLDPGCDVWIDGNSIYYGSNEPSQFKVLGNEEDYKFGDFECFTHKEIMLQPFTLSDTFKGRLSNGDIRISALDDNVKLLKKVKTITLIGEGSSYHAGLVGKKFIEDFTEINVRVSLASEYLQEVRPTKDGELVVLISQSGETADVLNCVRECKARAIPTMAITNGVDSQLSRLVDFGIYLRCGVEIGVASTKAFTSTVLVLALFAAKLGKLDRMTSDQVTKFFDQCIPDRNTIEQIERETKYWVDEFHSAKDLNKVGCFIFLGKCEFKAIAMEAALKMNELAYIPSLAYSLGSLKHGPLALMGPSAIVTLLGRDKYPEDFKTCLDQVKARAGDSDGIGDVRYLEYNYDNNKLERYETLHNILVQAIHCQLLAYYVAMKLGRDIDKPKNLAKSVTVK